MADITITEGDTLEVDYRLENTGDGTGTFDPRLLVQGTQEDQDTGITLDPAQTATGTLQWPTESGDAVTDALAEAVTDDTSDSITVTVESAIPDSGLDHELYRWNAQHALNQGIGADTSSFAWPEVNGQIGDATAVGAPILRSDQSEYAASEYDGSDDGHDWSPGGNAPTGDASHTFCATVYLKSTGGRQPIVSYGPDVNAEMSLLRTNDLGEIEFTWRSAGVTGSVVPSGSWVTLAGRYNSTSGDVTVFIDGSSVGSGSGPTFNLGASNGEIGYRSGAYGDFADIYVYDVVVSDDAESDSAIANYHNNMLG